MKLDHIFSSLSTAYRKGHSCETTLLRLNEDWKLAIDRKELVCILSTDMSKAFDSLSHSPTLTQLEAYGFESSALDLPWVPETFLARFPVSVKSSRKTSRRPSANTETSRRTREKPLVPRVRWASRDHSLTTAKMFNPLLSNVFQNDLPCSITTAKLSIYVDDHHTGRNIKNPET